MSSFLGQLTHRFRVHIPRHRLHHPILHPRRPLPPELWELVLEELCDESLLIAARVCTAFNDLCITIYLSRRNITRKKLGKGSLSIHSDLLPVLQLWRLTPQLHTLFCLFWAFDVLRNLKSLRSFLLRSGEIQEISISFYENVVTAHENDIFPYSGATLLTELGHVFRAMTAKTATPVVIVFHSHIYLIGAWGSRGSCHFPNRGPASWLEKARFSIKAMNGNPTLCRFVWGRGHPKKKVVIGDITGIHCKPVASGTAHPFTLITINKETERTLTLGPSTYSRVATTGSELACIIPHITLPSLETLGIKDGIDPTVFTEFLIRHPSIRCIGFNPSSAPIGKITTHPLALPRLERLDCDDPSHFGPLLDVFHMSPHLKDVSFHFRRQSSAAVGALKRGLRRLSLVPISINLRVFIWDRGKEPWEPIGDDEANIVGCLYGVSAMYINAYSISDVERIIPWLAMLPRLQRVQISTLIHHGDGPEVQELIEQARAALPWVPLIDARPW
ncbi:hypothetical protein B0H11DRAFT_2106211 [Mycena galericulata]|nr:hypothetical protein B0H11DRAFT_2106211 [Mycena galericulata]